MSDKRYRSLVEQRNPRKHLPLLNDLRVCPVCYRSFPKDEVTTRIHLKNKPVCVCDSCAARCKVDVIRT